MVDKYNEHNVSFFICCFIFGFLTFLIFSSYYLKTKEELRDG